MPFVLMLLFLVVFLTIFFVIIPHVGGWSKLAKHYGTDQKASTVAGQRIHFRQINIGGLLMKNIVKGYKTNKGLFLTQYFIIRRYTPNLLIPWNEFQPVEERQILFFKRYRLYIGHPNVSYIEISRRKFELIQDRIAAKRAL